MSLLLSSLIHSDTLWLLPVASILYLCYRRYTRISISHVPGPEPKSFLLGNLVEYFTDEASLADFRWQETYGDVVRFRSVLGEERLLICDPKALQHIHHTSGYNWHKQEERRELTDLIAGKGLLWADKDTHKRQRKVMLPGFGGPEVRAFLPVFAAHVETLTSRWKDILSTSVDEAAVMDVPLWLSRTALDTIGEAAFDYQFDAIDDSENDLGKAYFNLLSLTFASPSKLSLFMIHSWGFIPAWIRRFIARKSPMFDRARYTEETANKVARSLMESKTRALLQGKGNRDVMSILVQANASENPNAQLSEDEMLAQMRTLMLAGHETIAQTTSWALYELAKSPEIQQRLRKEIHDMEDKLRQKGQSNFKQSDFDAMPYLSAIVKEVLRYHPVLPVSHRQAGKDDVLPLSTPITTTKGEVIYELPVPKGLKVTTSVAGYNRNKQVFGEDAHIFNPERWLNGTVELKETRLGAYANILTFAGGVRTCIGWRFAVLELHVFLSELISNFEFALTPEAQHIRREAALTMVPTVRGEVEKGVQLPLRIRIAQRDE
ncbi:hypothetical protein HGRIS_001908 [Hohenbuehelia grisea]|uniref:Cytochrome P450 n=1 Tax=Hohenbuehelia grisea TaxID=104357 RepID=A0ABR3JIT8_9AGAR